jgi:membrane protease YdiL (CAAX protease family)
VVAVAVGRVDPRASGALTGWFAFAAIFSVLNYAARFSGPVPPKDVAYRWESSIAAIVQFGFILVVVLLIARGRNKRELFALRRPLSWGRAASISIAIIVGVFVMAQALAPFVDPEAEQGLTPTYWDSGRIAQFAAYAFAVTIVGPIVEELVFRGAGFSLLEPFGQWTAIVVVGVTFGLVHGLLEGLPIITAFGLGLAYLRSRTQSLYPCVLLHSAFNTVALIIGVTT